MGELNVRLKEEGCRTLENFYLVLHTPSTRSSISVGLKMVINIRTRVFEESREMMLHSCSLSDILRCALC